MPDYGKLREARKSPPPKRPSDIFARLVKPSHIRDLSPAQAEVLDEWYNRRDKRDIVLKLNTGAGKTLVALLAAQSTMNEIGGLVIYLCPNNQLVDQTIVKAQEVGIETERYVRGQAFARRFLSGEAIMVATYAALFNGHSRFGVEGDLEYVRASLVILDDAHVELSDLRDQFTLRFSADSKKEEERRAYAELICLLRPYFMQAGKPGLFEDIVDGKEYAVMELPYWLWFDVKQQVYRIAREQDRIEWPLLRDNFDHCHCFVGKQAISITPILPMVDMLPTFANARRRLFMSATIADNSVLAATFGLDEDALNDSISSTSLTGVSERMILIPGAHESLGKAELLEVVDDLVAEVPLEGKGAVVIVPSKAKAADWSGRAPLMDTPDAVAEQVAKMQSGYDYGPVVFASRYDGMDLNGDACRLLVIDGLPQGRAEYEIARGTALVESSEVAANLAQRLEQGMGRGARGSSDYCAVVLLGDDIISWLSDKSHWDFMTASTRAQIGIGEDLTAALADAADFKAAVLDCVRHKDVWVRHHVAELADRVAAEKQPARSDSPMMIEREAFELMRSGNGPKAVDVLLEACSTESPLSTEYKGWFMQMAARYTWLRGDHDRAQRYQEMAYRMNRRVFPPNADIVYEPMEGPALDQAVAVLTAFNDFLRGKGYIAKVEMKLRDLRSEATANQFEGALMFLGTVLGFAADRPEGVQGKGPDVLWLTHERRAFVIEAKSRKMADNPLNKAEKGQLLSSCEWFKKSYPEWELSPVVVMPKAIATEAASFGPGFCLTLESLNRLRVAVVDALNAIRKLPAASATRAPETAAILRERNLTADTLAAFFEEFVVVEDRAGEAVPLFTAS
ncbi:MAG: DEAD/DEAH box helicase [Firmicutes bacterium]|nr:DEAD/DEAH box helicase [Bacillota bacterium]